VETISMLQYDHSTITAYHAEKPYLQPLLFNNIPSLRHLTHQELPLLARNLTHAEPRQLQHLHILQRVALLSLPCLQFFESDWSGKLLPKGHVYDGPFRVIRGRGRVVVGCRGIMR
jgi:hypothetical protein